MIEYIKQYVDLVIRTVKMTYDGGTYPPGTNDIVQDGKAGMKALYEELQRLDPRDFEPSAQTEFVRVRANLHHFAFAPNWQHKQEITILNDINPVPRSLPWCRQWRSSSAIPLPLRCEIAKYHREGLHRTLNETFPCWFVE